MYLRFQHFPGVFALDMWWLLKMWRRWCPRLTSGPGVGGYSDDGQLGGQSKSFHCCVSFGGVSVFCMSTIYTILVFVFFVTFDLAF